MTPTQVPAPEEVLKFLKIHSKSSRYSNGTEPIPTVEEIKAKRAKLDEVEKVLKNEFAGLDAQIDKVIAAIRPWYLLPQAQSRPTVVCLWGMTGVGKTSVVLRLVELLNFQEALHHEDLGNYTGESRGLISYGLTRQTGKPNVMLFDELHLVRTRDAMGMEIDRPSLRQFWKLLDDGQIPIDNEDKRQFVFTLQSMLDQVTSYPESLTQGLQDHMIDRILMDLEVPARIADVRALVKADAKSFVEWAIDEYNWFISYSKTFDFRRALIFVTGNLDEVFQDANRLYTSDFNSDDLHKKTSQISTDMVKNKLLGRFLPEQVARLGSMHILFPSLSRLSFEKIITRQLHLISARSERDFKIKIDFEKSVHKFLFSESAIPSQGARIVLSNMKEQIETFIPDWLVRCLEEGVASLKITYDFTTSKLIAADAKTGRSLSEHHLLSSEGRLPKIEISENLALTLTSHEAGHAVAGICALGVMPIKVLTGQLAWHQGGPRVMFPFFNLQTEDVLRGLIAMTLGGYAGEKLLLGKLSGGAAQDIEQATVIASDMISRFGMDEHVGYSLPEPGFPASIVKFRDQDDVAKEKLLAAGLETATAALKSQWDLLLAMQESLLKEEKLTRVQMETLIRKNFKGPKDEIERIIKRTDPKFFDQLPEIKKSA